MSPEEKFILARKWIQKYKSHFNNFDDQLKETLTCLVTDALQEALSINETQWIDVTNELPKPKYKGEIIPVIISRNENAPMKVVGCFYVKGEGFATDEGLHYDDVTHWMHVPEAYNKK